MGKLEAFNIAGLDLFFLSLDHRPPHMHVRKPGEWEIRVYFLECTKDHLEYQVKWNMKTRILTKTLESELLRNVIANREALLTEWDKKVCKD